MGAEDSPCSGRTGLVIFPVFFPDSRETEPESSSHQTASTATAWSSRSLLARSGLSGRAPRIDSYLITGSWRVLLG